MTFEQRLAQTAMLVEERLSAFLTEASVDGAPPRLVEAMRHAALGGGKRFRPFLLVECAGLFGLAPAAALQAAAALECLHCYSLVHDDLPAMDDDDFRRGRPTCHKVHGEAMAILAGDALLTRAFEVVARRAPSRVAAAVAAELARAAGIAGMVNGQAADLLSEGTPPTEERVRWIHERKTGALFSASARIGALCAGAGEALLAAASSYGLELGLAFQVVDDLLGKSGDPRTPGKPVGKDDERGKLTYPAAIGEAAARARAAALSQKARQQAVKFPRPDELDALAQKLLERVS